MKGKGVVCIVKERFLGSAGRPRLVAVLTGQKMVAGDSALAEDLAGLVEIVAVQAGEAIIRQSDPDNQGHSKIARVARLGA
jgi:CRP/FNR family transcriptional regulator, cyclic AMP receptor protein